MRTLSEPLFQQKFCGSAPGYRSPSQLTNREAVRNDPICGFKMLGYRLGQKVCSCSLPLCRRKNTEGARCSLDRNWLIYNKLSLGHTSTLLMKSCHCFYSCISTTSVACNGHAQAFLCPALGCIFVLLFHLEWCPTNSIQQNWSASADLTWDGCSRSMQLLELGGKIIWTLFYGRCYLSALTLLSKASISMQ